MVEDMDILSNVFGHNNHIDICLSIFLPLFNVFCNVLHVLDVSWPSGYWETLSGDLLGDFQCTLLIIMPNFLHLLMNSMSHICIKAIYWKSIN